MDRSKVKILAVGALLASFFPVGGETPFNLFQSGRFEPITMHGQNTAARGWYLFDNARAAAPVYTPGDKCFTLDFPGDDSLIFRFHEPLNDAYQRNRTPLFFGSRIPWPKHAMPPAKEYRITGRLLFESGALRLSNGHRFQPSPGWRNFNIVSPEPCNGFYISPAAGAAYGFADLQQTAVYPEIGGAIRLPDGGKLTRFLLPRNAGYVMRWSIAMWRGWLWRLTGVALPIEEVDEVKALPEAFAAVTGETAPGGWNLKVDGGGIVLTVGDEKSIVPALFDYLRVGLKCGFYRYDCVKLPIRVDMLPAIDRHAAPRFHALTGDDRWFLTNSGVDLVLLYARNDVDYYHLPEPRNDHILNVILPQELYFREHPEYFMTDRDGNRAERRNPFFTNPCFSNADAEKIMLRNLLAYAKGQTLAKEIIFETGDIQDHCVCPACVAFNGGTRSNTDSQFAFANKFMRLLEKECPGMTLTRCAYYTRQEPPQKVKLESLRVPVIFCLDHTVFPCTLHTDCSINARGMELMRKWLDFVDGDKSRICFMTYSDIRPLHHAKFMDLVNHYGSGTLYMFNWKGYSPATAFVTGRWNLGEKIEDLLEEFNNAYYGPAAGPLLTQIAQLVEEYAATYRHPKSDFGRRSHIGVWGSDMGETHTLLDRDCFDRIYALFDKALAAVRNDRTLLRRVIIEKSYYLAEDIHRFNRFKAKNREELVAFSARLAELIGMARAFPDDFNTMLNTDARNYIMSVAGIAIPRGRCHWSREAIVDRFLADPMAMFQSNPEPFPAGLYFKPLNMKAENTPAVYSYRCPPRSAVALTRPRFGKEKLSVALKLKAAVTHPTMLAVEGLDDDKPGASAFVVSVNGIALYRGKVTFPENQWGRMGFSIPGGILKAGDNMIEIACTTPEAEEPEKGNDPQWGWVQISEICWFDPNTDFRNCLEGKNSVWHFGAENPQYLPRGEAKAGGGKVVIRGGRAKRTGICYFREHRFPCIAMKAGDTIRFRITASGRGNLHAGLWQYRPYQWEVPGRQRIAIGGYSRHGSYLGAAASKPMVLGSEPKEYLCEVAATGDCGSVIPEIFVTGNGEAIVTALSMELIPALR